MVGAKISLRETPAPIRIPRYSDVVVKERAELPSFQRERDVI